jgi:H+/gluconate symporter-like permease
MMTLLVLAYLGGVLTIISPCILPVLPFVFARADRSFVRNGLPILAGMALTFAAVKPEPVPERALKPFGAATKWPSYCTDVGGMPVAMEMVRTLSRR